MIHPSQLTKEAGFEEGVVVEITRSTHRYEFPEVGRIKFPMGSLEESPIIYVGGVLMGLQDIISIRPLTGPMAIWNFAPDDAMAALGHMKDGKIHTLFWAPHMGNTIAIWDGYECFEWARPWWCK